MARYIMLRIEETETATKLLERFSVVPAIQVVGLFGIPTKFCSCASDSGRSIRSRKWGTWHCPECKLAKGGRMQQPRNLLQDIDLHPRFADMFLSVWEPFFNKPEEKYGADTLERVEAQVNQAKERVSKSKRRRARKNGG